ncbi:MAG: hypothetical protein WDZ39_00665 [Candidatus Spechtbacterales bacterium]
MNLPIKTKLLLAAGLLFVFVVTAIIIIDLTTSRPEPEDRQIFELKREALDDMEFRTENERGFTSGKIVSRPEDNFEITYQEEADRFNIVIMTGERDPDTHLSEDEIYESIDVAEKYFLRNVLETDDEDLACKLNVHIIMIGEGPMLFSSAPLSFCDK